MTAARWWLALDLGTTTLTGRLCDARGRIVAAGEHPNPQAPFGADVITRLQRARDGEGAALAAALREGIDTLARQLCATAGVPLTTLGTAAAAANPAIIHLLSCWPVAPLLAPPYRPHITEPPPVDLPGWPCPLQLLPLVNGYVGGDLLAVLLALEAGAEMDGNLLVVDIGTNAEIGLRVDGRWQVTSVAAGPAFEGGTLSSGMRHGPGAITDVQRDGDRLQLTVAGGGTPQGLCGSGLVAAIAAGRAGGLIDATGRLFAPDEVATNLGRYLVPHASGHALCLYRDARRQLLVTQEDLRAFQLAKAAVRTGVVCLLQRAELAASAVERVVLTGAFGFSLPSAALSGVALLPENMVEKVRFLPDGALAGVARFLGATDGPARLADLRRRITPYPLSGTPAFERAFLSSMDF